MAGQPPPRTRPEEIAGRILLFGLALMTTGAGLYFVLEVITISASLRPANQITAILILIFTSAITRAVYFGLKWFLTRIDTDLRDPGRLIPVRELPFVMFLFTIVSTTFGFYAYVIAKGGGPFSSTSIVPVAALLSGEELIIVDQIRAILSMFLEIGGGMVFVASIWMVYILIKIHRPRIARVGLLDR